MLRSSVGMQRRRLNAFCVKAFSDVLDRFSMRRFRHNPVSGYRSDRRPNHARIVENPTEVANSTASCRDSLHFGKATRRISQVYTWLSGPHTISVSDRIDVSTVLTPLTACSSNGPCRSTSNSVFPAFDYPVVLTKPKVDPSAPALLIWICQFFIFFFFYYSLKLLGKVLIVSFTSPTAP